MVARARVMVDRQQAREHFAPWAAWLLLAGGPMAVAAVAAPILAWRGDWQQAAILAVLPGLTLAGLFARPIRDLATAWALAAQYRAASRSTDGTGQSLPDGARRQPPARP